jgi:hypothetical protein
MAVKGRAQCRHENSGEGVVTPILNHPCRAMILEEAQSLSRVIEMGCLFSCGTAATKPSI